MILFSSEVNIVININQMDICNEMYGILPYAIIAIIHMISSQLALNNNNSNNNIDSGIYIF